MTQHQNVLVKETTLVTAYRVIKGNRNRFNHMPAEKLEVFYNDDAIDVPSEVRQLLADKPVSTVHKTTERKPESPPAVEAPKAASKRQRRTEAEMLESFKGDLLGEAKYLQDRAVKLEEKLAELFGSVSPEAASLVLKSDSFKHLSRYLP